MKRTTLRISPELHQALAVVAKDDQRSLNAEIVFAIQELLRKCSKRRHQTQKREKEFGTRFSQVEPAKGSDK